MTFTTSELNNWYDRFNAKYFNNELNRCPIYINKTKRALGQFKANRWYNSCEILISNYLDRPIKDVQNTLLHEMVHQWQWVNYGHCDHKYTFKMKAQEINKDGWYISRCNSTDGCIANYVAPNKTYQICIFKRGTMFCKSVLASNRVDYFKGWIPTIDGITDIHFGVTTDPSFDKLVASRKRLTWYTMSEDEYNSLVGKMYSTAV